MPITFKCANCGKALRVRDELAGKRVRCPQCQNPLTIPAAAAPAATSPVAARPAENKPLNRPAENHKPVANAGSGKCPSCTREIPAGTQICPHCHYHLKLRRTMRISQAIKTADMHSQGLNLDGSKKVTRADLAEQREEQGRKIGRGMQIAASVAVIAAIIAGVFFVRGSLAARPLAKLRSANKLKPLVAQKPDTYQPVWMYMEGDKKQEITLPITALTVVETSAGDPKNGLKMPAPWPQGTAAWAAFAEALMPPVMNTVSEIKGNLYSRYSAEPGSTSLPTLIAHADALGGEFAPTALMNAAPSGPFCVWRLAADLQTKGSLRGALFSFSRPAEKNTLLEEISGYRNTVQAYEKAVNKLLAASDAETPPSRSAAEKELGVVLLPEVRLEGRLSCFPFINRDLTGGAGSFAVAVRNGAALVRNPENAPRRPAGEKLKHPDDCYFVPVWIVDKVEVIRPKVKKRTKVFSLNKAQKVSKKKKKSKN